MQMGVTLVELNLHPNVRSGGNHTLNRLSRAPISVMEPGIRKFFTVFQSHKSKNIEQKILIVVSMHLFTNVYVR